MDRQSERGNRETSVALSCNDGKRGHGSQNPIPDDWLSRNLMGRDGSNDFQSDGVDMDNGRPMSPGTLALMCDERDKMPNRVADHGQNTSQSSSNGNGFSVLYAEQERLVLTGFRNVLNWLIVRGSTKGK